MKIAITGATGFVGQHLIEELISKNLASEKLVIIGRSSIDLPNTTFFKRPIDKAADYNKALKSVNVVVHCAARAHIMNESLEDPLTEFRGINTFGTLNLAQQAAANGVKRFIFISSIKVNGEQTDSGEPFRANNKNIPTDPYGLSKYEAEVGLREIAKNTGMEVVIIRPPLVYGPGVKANFSAMIKLASKGWPLPFGGLIHNQRSLVSVDNLVDLIITCLVHPNAGDEVFLVSDNEDLSTAGMFKRLSVACGKTGFLIPIPAFIFKVAFKFMGKANFYQRLCGSLQVDISETCEKLNWQPPHKVDVCFARTAKYFLENK